MLCCRRLKAENAQKIKYVGDLKMMIRIDVKTIQASKNCLWDIYQYKLELEQKQGWLPTPADLPVNI